MNARFYAPGAREVGQLVALPTDEAAHATRVLRLHAGDAVRVFDGSGHEFAGVIEQATKRIVQVRLQQRHEPAQERRTQVTLVPAVLKGDKMDDVVRDAVMMGVTSIVPIVTARTEVSLATLQRGQRREKWERIAIGSAKQCGRAVVPLIEEACDLATVRDRLMSTDGSRDAFVFVEPEQASSAVPVPRSPRSDPQSIVLDPRSPIPDPRPESAIVLVGPEGGWTSEEVAAMAGLAAPVTLRGPTLRADAMPIAALSVLYARWGEF